MQVRLYSDSDRSSWEAMVASAGDATTGHLWEWGQIIRDAYGFQPFYVVAEDSHGSPIAAAPFVLVRSVLYGNELTSLPYIDYGGVCHATKLEPEERTDADIRIYGFATELAQSLKAKRLHIRSPRPCDSPFEVSTEKVTQHLDLCSSAEEQLKKLPSERRNRLKKCLNRGLSTDVVSVTDDLALAEFSSVYSENMRNLGSPTHSVTFFKSVAAHIRDWCKLILIRYKGQTLAAGIAFVFRNMISLPWTGATLEARPLYATNALYWAGMCLGIEQSCHTFDFGRSSIGSGIYEFKRQWGPKPVQPYWSTLYLKSGSKRPKERRELQLASRIWRHMPLSVSRVIGPALRRGISN